jgi:hypothetical protein
MRNTLSRLSTLVIGVTSIAESLSIIPAVYFMPHLTRMRSPPVKRQTIPMSGFFLFFPLTGPGAVDSQSRVLTRFPDAGANPAWLHHTRLEALSPPWWRLQSTVGVLLCGLEMMRCPRTGLFTGVARPVRRARESQARERGSPRPLSRLSPRMKEPERVSNHSPGLWDTKPMRTLAFRDAVQQDLEHACDRLLPGVAREASGSPALRP